MQVKKYPESSLSLYENRLQNDSVAIVRVPTELGSDARGLAQAPQYLFKHGLERALASLGAYITQDTVIPCPEAPLLTSGSAIKNLPEVATVAQETSDTVAQAVQKGDLVLALGGDHSMAIGTVAGASKVCPRLGVIWIDAHPDVNTEETTLSGNIHGMSAAALMGFGDPLLTTVGGKGPAVAPEDFLFIGAKDFDQAEIDFIRREKIQTITTFDIAQQGLLPVTEAVDVLSKKVDAVWVSMDLDSVDVAFAPGVAIQNDGGLTGREVLSVARYIGKTCKLAGLDVIEVLPAKDKEGMTAALALELVSLFLGGDTGPYYDYMRNYEESRNIGVLRERVE